jgi:hypothetical protein
MTQTGDSIDDFIAKNTVPSASANGKQRKKGSTRESERDQLQKGTTAPGMNSMEPNVPEAGDNTAGRKLGGDRKTRTQRAREGAGMPEEDVEKKGYDPFSGAPPSAEEQYYTEDEESYAGFEQNPHYQVPNHEKYTQHPPIPGQQFNTQQVRQHPRVAQQPIAPQYQHLVQQPQVTSPPVQPQVVYQEVVKEVEVPVEVEKEVIKEVEVEIPSEVDAYLDGSKRITIKTNDGMFMLPAVDVRTTDDCVTLLLPIKEDNTTFIPNRGTEMTVIWREGGADRSERVFFPGTCVEVQELRVIIVALIVIGDDK